MGTLSRSPKKSILSPVMATLPLHICLQLKEARKAKGLSQTALAQVVGCKQSALSMFEAGDPTKISDETVEKLATHLGVKLVEKTEKSADSSENTVPLKPMGQVQFGFCPNGHCPSNIPYAVEGKLFYRPSRQNISSTGGTRCVHCGDVLEMRCPTCGAPINEGACCAICGQSYVAAVLPEGVDAAVYARVRREEITQIRALS